jgi:hypothetical protein
MIFGDHVRSPDTVASARWIAAVCRGVCGTVGAWDGGRLAGGADMPLGARTICARAGRCVVSDERANGAGSQRYGGAALVIGIGQR